MNSIQASINPLGLRSLHILIAAGLILAGCGVESDRKNNRRDDKQVTTKENDATSDIPDSIDDPLPKGTGDRLAKEFENTAEAAENARRELKKQDRESDKKTRELSELTRMGEDLVKAGKSNFGLSIFVAIGQAINSVNGNLDDPLISVRSTTFVRREDLSMWLESLSESSTAELNEADRKTKLSGDGWLMTMEITVNAKDQQQKKTLATRFVNALRNSRQRDKSLWITHVLLRESDEKMSIECAVRKR